MGRIAAFTEKVVPIMAALYLLGGLIVLLANASHIIPALKMVFVGAFDPAAATGGIIGAGVKEAMRYGVARGLFSNEAGMGSTLRHLRDQLHRRLHHRHRPDPEGF